MEILTNEKIDIADPEFERIRKIGSGAFGKVFLCKNTSTNKLFAVKEMQISFLNESTINAEIRILKVMPPHERLVTFYGIRKYRNKIQIFNEYMSKGSLRDFMEKEGTLSELKTAEYVKKIVEGIDFLHENNIIHRDIKCGNILLDDQDNIKLADFGMSKPVDNKSILENHTFCGTLYFMAPEMLLEDSYSSSVDIWALGVTVVEMLTGIPIYFSLKGGSFIAKITDNSTIEYVIPPNSSAKLHYFLRLTFTKDATLRPKSRDLLRTKFLLNAGC